MRPIEYHEQFEIEVLQFLNSKNLLNNLVFGGGTMLRLCYELNRYSIDLDFYFKKQGHEDSFFQVVKDAISSVYEITDSENKRNTQLFEFRSPQYPMRLKIEINKQKLFPVSKQSIAYSQHSNFQVFLSTIPLEKMMENKIEALLSRKETRDAFDIEFMVKSGISFSTDPGRIESTLSVIQSFSKKDLKVKLGSLLPADARVYYSENGFVVLKRHLKKLLSDV